MSENIHRICLDDRYHIMPSLVMAANKKRTDQNKNQYFFHIIRLFKVPK